jgi:hypothetical protein
MARSTDLLNGLTRRIVVTAGVIVTLMTAACGKPTDRDLRESFAQQMAANKVVKDFQKNGDDLTFTGPGADGTVMKWRVHIDSSAIDDTKDAEKPYKGTVKSSWYAGTYKVVPDRFESNLPLELISTGLAQDCWAVWNKTTKKWEWE